MARTVAAKFLKPHTRDGARRKWSLKAEDLVEQAADRGAEIRHLPRLFAALTLVLPAAAEAAPLKYCSASAALIKTRLPTRETGSFPARIARQTVLAETPCIRTTPATPVLTMGRCETFCSATIREAS